MEGKFETSFIPRKNIVPAASVSAPRGTNLITVICIALLLLVVGGGVALFAYTSYLKKHNEEIKVSITTELDNLKPNEVRDLSRMDSRLRSSKELIDKHLALSDFFAFLGDVTLKNVRFTTFKYNQVADKITLAMEGQAQSFSAVALQSAEFAKPENTSFVKDPQFSNLSLDSSGNVTFSFAGTIAADKISYRNLVGRGEVVPVTVESVEEQASTTPSHP